MKALETALIVTVSPATSLVRVSPAITIEDPSEATLVTVQIPLLAASVHPEVTSVSPGRKPVDSKALPLSEIVSVAVVDKVSAVIESCSPSTEFLNPVEK